MARNGRNRTSPPEVPDLQSGCRNHQLSLRELVLAGRVGYRLFAASLAIVRFGALALRLTCGGKYLHA